MRHQYVKNRSQCAKTASTVDLHCQYLGQVVITVCMVGKRLNSSRDFPINKIHTPVYGSFCMETLENKRMKIYF